MDGPARETKWIGSSLKTMRAFPDQVRRSIGLVLRKLQNGETDPSVKALAGLKEFRGSSILQISEAFDGDAYRAVVTVAHEEAIYVLHVFQKKSKQGAKTPRHEIDVILKRLQTVRDFRESPEGLALRAKATVKSAP